MTSTMSHHKLSSSLSVKASVLTLVVMVAGVLFAPPSSAMGQQGTGGEVPTLLPPTNGTGDTPSLANATGAITPPPTNATGGEVPTLLPPTNGTGDTPSLANATGAITPPPTNATGAITPPPTNATGAITPPPTVGVAAPLTAEIAANPVGGNAPLTVELSAVVAGGTPAYTYNWDFGDGSAVTRILEVATVQHIFENAGIYTVAVTVTDTSGQVVTANLEITVNEPPPPAEEPPAEEPPAEEPPAEEPPAEEPPAE
jgi:PKD repeat protein